ncbi:MAG: helix-turn-helix transcriptional regulator [Clostridia bacterium]|nr:helix-turn-helix transcriptional regulator [Clostridia bacterium]
MIFYRIQLKGVPKIKYALHKGVANYRHEFNRIKNYLEVCLIDDGAPTIVDLCDGSFIAEKDTLIGLTQDMNLCAHSKEESVHRCIGVNVEYAEQRFDSEKLSDHELKEIIEHSKKDGEFLIPIQVHLEEALPQVKTMMRKITRAHHSQNTGNWADSVSGWFELMAFLTRFTVVRLLSEHLKLSPAQYRYVEEIKRYIHHHASEKIYIKNIADSLSLSESYIHRLFRTATGHTLSFYINSIKIKNAAEYIQKYNASASDAARSVGIEDSLYFSRLFKKHYNISVTEYKKQIKLF